MRILESACALGAILLLATEGAYALSPTQTSLLAQIQHALESDGARSTIGRYFRCTGDQSGYALVASGDPSAITLGIELLQSSDGCVSELLSSSIATALQRHPRAVLPFFISRIKPSAQTCIPLMIEVSRAQVGATLDRTEAALKGVMNPELQGPRDACLREVASYRAAASRG